MFPTGWPGLALLLLRTALGMNILYGLLGVYAMFHLGWTLALSTLAAALLLGLFTPVIAAASIPVEIGIMHFSRDGLGVLHACGILVAAALIMLGPGAYSVDARLFGRRRVTYSSRDTWDGE